MTRAHVHLFPPNTLMYYIWAITNLPIPNLKFSYQFNFLRFVFVGINKFGKSNLLNNWKGNFDY